MDDLNVLHVLAPTFEDIEHGVRLCAQDDVQSRTLVCFLDRNQALHFGFGHRNGSNLRVVCWEDNNRRSKTVPKGGLIIAFAQDNVRDEVRSLNRRQDRVADITERLAVLTIEQLDVINQKIDGLQGNN